MAETVKRLDNNLSKRVVTALILVPLTLAVLFFAPLFVKQVVVFLLALGLTYEWSSFTQAPFARLAGIVLISFPFILYGFLGNAPSDTVNDSIVLAFVIASFVLAYFPQDKIFTFGQVYILIASLTLCSLLNQPSVILWMLLLAWLNDSCAYFVGRWAQGPKLWVAVSPKKTLSGFIGGVLIGSILSGALASYLGLASSPYVLSFILSLMGHGGDLVESAAKRYYGVKDSSHILPGHGGLLDRLDSLLAMLIAYKILMFFF